MKGKRKTKFTFELNYEEVRLILDGLNVSRLKCVGEYVNRVDALFYAISDVLVSDSK